MSDRTDRVLSAFSGVSAAAQRMSDIDSLLHVIAGQMSDLVGVERCSIHMRDKETDIFRGCVARSGDAILDDIKRSSAGGPADGITRELLETRRPVVVARAQQDRRMVRSTARYWDIHSIMAVPMTLDDEVTGVIFLDDPGTRHTFTEEDEELAMRFAELSGGAVAQAQARIELHSQLEAAGRQLTTLRRARAVDEHLTKLVVEGRPLRDLIATLADVLAKPCAVYSPSGERLARAVPSGETDDVAPRLLEPRFASQSEVRDALTSHEGSRAFVVGPLPHAGILHRHVVAPVMLGSELWGRLVVMEHKSRFTGGDIVTVGRAATVLALQVSADRKVVEADWNASSSLAADLLSCRSDPVLIKQRADRLGVGLDVPRIVMVIGARSGREEEAPNIRATAAAFERVTPDLTPHMTVVPGAVAVLIDVPADGAPDSFVADTREALDAFRKELGDDEFVAGISSPRSDPDGYREAYDEARQVLECIQRFSPPGGPAMFTSDDLGVGRLFLSTCDRDAMARFADEAVARLLDDPSGPSLLITLWSFFENLENIRVSAAQLGVHENTIRHRLSRLEEITGLAVTHDPEAQLQVRMMLLVLLLQGRLFPEPVPPSSARPQVLEGVV